MRRRSRDKLNECRAVPRARRAADRIFNANFAARQEMGNAYDGQAKHPRHLGRRHRVLENQPLQQGHDGLPNPNIDRIAQEGATFTDWYGQQSCTAGRASFITGQNPVRTGLTKVGMPGATVGLHAEDPTIAEMLKPLGYATGQFGKNHLGDRDEYLPTVHGFDEFFGNLYHLNAEEEPELRDYPKDPEFKKKFGPRGVLHCLADGKGGQKRSTASSNFRRVRNRRRSIWTRCWRRCRITAATSDLAGLQVADRERGSVRAPSPLASRRRADWVRQDG
jgi:hypothetical protein